MSAARVILVTVAGPAGQMDLGVRSDATPAELAASLGDVLGVGAARPVAEHRSPPRPGSRLGERALLSPGTSLAAAGVADGDLLLFRRPEDGGGRPAAPPPGSARDPLPAAQHGLATLQGVAARHGQTAQAGLAAQHRQADGSRPGQARPPTVPPPRPAPAPPYLPPASSLSGPATPPPHADPPYGGAAPLPHADPPYGGAAPLPHAGPPVRATPRPQAGPPTAPPPWVGSTEAAPAAHRSSPDWAPGPSRHGRGGEPAADGTGPAEDETRPDDRH